VVRFRALSLALALPAFAAAPSGPAAHADALNRAFSAAAVKGDAAALGALYTKDAELFFFKGSTFKGREDIHAFFDGFFKDTKLKAMAITTEESHLMGGAILDIGHYEMTTVDKDGKEETSKGRYIQVIKKGQDGKWRYFRDCPLPD